MNNKDRTNFTKLTRSGISLIVLIITIIVVIILASVVILTMSRNNPLKSAKEATFKSDVRNFQDELAMYVGNQVLMDYGGTREKIETDDMPSTEIMKSYIESFSSKYENKLGIYKDELVYYKPDEDVKNKVTDEEEKWLQDLGIKKKIVETREESFEWGSDDPNNPEYYTLTKFIGSETNVIVPARCHKVGANAFEYSKVTNVKLQEGVTHIGDNAFYSCDYLTNISLPNTLIDIGMMSFRSCSKLENIALPDSLEYLSTFSFSSCGNLKSITIPKKVRYIPTCAFSGCSSLEEVILPDNLFGIHNEAFQYCTNLKNIVLPDSVGYVASKAFGKSGIMNITIPKNLTNIEGGAFLNCQNLVSINVDENNSMYSSVDGVLYSKDRKDIVQFPAGKNVENYTIDNNVEYILNEAFYGCEKLKNITLGNNVKSIGDYSFMYCSNLTDINIPSSLEEIKYNSFGVCTNLSNIYIPANVQKIGSIAFHMCNNLTIDCEVEESNIPTGWSSNWYGSAKAVNYGVKK